MYRFQNLTFEAQYFKMFENEKYILVHINSIECVHSDSRENNFNHCSHGRQLPEHTIVLENNYIHKARKANCFYLN